MVVGAGILGLATARELRRRRPDLKTVVFERESAPARHQTGHNSGVIHAGIYYLPGSLKARMCVQGARVLYDYLDERGIPYRRSGKLIVALDAGELAGLNELERRGRANGVAGLRRLGSEELREIEPHCRGLAALHSRATGVVDFGEVARALADELGANGVLVATSCEVTGVEHGGRRLSISHTRGKTRARMTVFCAGAWADELAVRDGASADPRIVPFRGAYLRLRPERAHLVRNLIYPVPNPDLPFLGVHLSRHMNQVVSLGPSALLAPARDAHRLKRMPPRELARTLAWPGTWRMGRKWWRTGLTELRQAFGRGASARAAARYVPEIGQDDLEPWFAGVRAQALGRDGRLLDDFVLSARERSLHVRNAPSPAATSSLALARLIADRAEPGLD